MCFHNSSLFDCTGCELSSPDEHTIKDVSLPGTRVADNAVVRLALDPHGSAPSLIHLHGNIDLEVVKHECGELVRVNSATGLVVAAIMPIKRDHESAGPPQCHRRARRVPEDVEVVTLDVDKRGTTCGIA